jgi:hypothetical protein
MGLFGRSWVKENIPDWREVIIVSPDAGGAKRYALPLLPSFLFISPFLSLVVRPLLPIVSTSTLL